MKISPYAVIQFGLAWGLLIAKRNARANKREREQANRKKRGATAFTLPCGRVSVALNKAAA